MNDFSNIDENLLNEIISDGDVNASFISARIVFDEDKRQCLEQALFDARCADFVSNVFINKEFRKRFARSLLKYKKNEISPTKMKHLFYVNYIVDEEISKIIRNLSLTKFVVFLAELYCGYKGNLKALEIIKQLHNGLNKMDIANAKVLRNILENRCKDANYDSCGSFFTNPTLFMFEQNIFDVLYNLCGFVANRQEKEDEDEKEIQRIYNESSDIELCHQTSSTSGPVPGPGPGFASGFESRSKPESEHVTPTTTTPEATLVNPPAVQIEQTSATLNNEIELSVDEVAASTTIQKNEDWQIDPHNPFAFYSAHLSSAQNVDDIHVKQTFTPTKLENITSTFINDVSDSETEDAEKIFSSYELKQTWRETDLDFE